MSKPIRVSHPMYNLLPTEIPAPFSQPALEIWQGEKSHVSAAQQALYHRARCNRAARRGEHSAAMERRSL
ncbi:MAG: fructose-bisphosphate aldolase [Proteobacteria bacterium]|nr:fructose-bisphosphate aldolase [Pseudomonadota bacterium]MBU4295589.1 fructose-bisphosphate aldolase [Pseudomonadota bacterium]